MIVDYHVHLERAGIAPGNAMRFIGRALSAGVGEIALTEHAYNFVELAPFLQRPDYVARHGHGFRLDDYMGMVRSLSRELEDRGVPIKVRLGLEVDYVPESLEELAARWPRTWIWSSAQFADRRRGIDLGPDHSGTRQGSSVCNYCLTAEAAASGVFIIDHPTW